MDIWAVDVLDDGRISLIAPDGIELFAVSPETAEMIGQMLIDEAQEEVYDERQETIEQSL